jgi:hypothetical protein
VKDRLLIKSAICSASQGLFDEEVRDEEGGLISPRKLKQEPIKFPNDMSKVVYGISGRTLTITIDGKDTSIPISDHAYSQRDKS